MRILVVIEVQEERYGTLGDDNSRIRVEVDRSGVDSTDIYTAAQDAADQAVGARSA